ncbi:protein-tyrosine phosphatase-like protein [Aspergillus ambiguus]|uniref:tyrosine-protein phosphatase n=1 Tax=Aspergillus ambiguus TaxID=176160 RepID=UPI003CCC9C17
MDPEDLLRLLQTDIRTELPADVVAGIITKPPFVSVPGIFNVRDLSSAGSSVLRPGLAYRSGAPASSLSAEAQLALAQTLGITTIFDLRRPLERAKLPHPVIDGVQSVWVPYAFEAPPPDYADFGGSDGGMASFTKLYRSYLDTHVPIYRKVFEHIRDRPQDPFLFHCSAGKDRTGVLAALILRVAGCSDAAILHDYMLTRAGIEPARPRLAAMLKAHHGLEGDDLERTGMVTLFGVQMQGMRGFLCALDEIGGAERYLHMRLGFSDEDVRVIRENLQRGK